MFRTLLALLGIAVLSGCSLFGVRSGYEQPAYEVVDRIGESVEVRRYGTRLAAEAVVEPAGDEEERNAAFRLLFDYISGENRAAEQIAMTAPVAEDDRSESIAMTVPVESRQEAAGRYAMRFFLPAAYTRESAPQPLDPRVRLVELPAQEVAVLQFSGGRGEARVAARQDRLAEALAATKWRPAGPPVAFFYDPPWTLPFLRRNEVAVPVTGG